MVVSFKVAKVGKRYRPNQNLQDKDSVDESDSQERIDDNDEQRLEEVDVSSNSNDMDISVQQQVPEDLEVSFSLNLFQTGFCVGKPKELFDDVPMKLLPYDRVSEAIFTAIEYGWLPGDVFDQIPCKYVNGAVLCEIQDYRNCLFQRGGMGTTANSPIIHKLILKMCMENVLKDISSTLNECWTYEALLEVESRILKALQPDLQLNPKLISHSALPCKKINLGINWDRRKRYLNDTSECNLQHIIQMQSTGGVKDSKSQSAVANQRRQVQVSQNNTSSAVPSFEVDGRLENIQSNPLTLKHNYQFSYGYPTSACADLSLSSTTSSKRGRESFSLVPYEKSGYEGQPIEGPALKKPKQEPGELSLPLPLPQPTGTEIVSLLSNKNMLYQQTEAGKFSYQRGPFLLRKTGEQELPQSNPKLHPKMSISIVKKEPAETTKLFDSNVQKMKDKSLTVNTTSCQSDIQRKQSQISLLSSKVCSVPVNTIGKRNSNATKKRKGLPTTQGTSGVRNAPSDYINYNSLVRDASLPSKQQNNISRVSSVKMTDSLANTSNLHTAGVRSTTGNPQPHPISNAELNFYLQRFNKLGRVTKRYKLNDRKKKSGSCIQRKTFLWTPLVSQHLANLDDNDNAGMVTSMSKYSLSQELETSKSRTLTFVHQSCVRQRKDNTQFDSGNQIKLVLSEIMNEGKVEVTVLYGVEESDYTSMTFPSVGLAEQYVAQFKSLMEKEGYCITEDPIEPVAANSIGNELSMPYQIFEGSTSNSPAMADRIPNLDITQSSSRSHLLTSVNLQPPVQLLPRNLSDFQSDSEAEQVNPTYLSEILVKHVNLQAQIMQRKRLHEQFIQKMKAEASVAALHVLGMTQLGGAAIYADALQVGNLDISNWNSQNQQFGVNFRQPTSFPARLGLSPDQEEVAMNGISTQNLTPTLADRGYQMNGQQLSQPQMCWPYLPQQQEMMALLESAEPGQHVHLPLSQVKLQQFDQLP